MIVLDTNVVSELMLARPEPRVVAWADRQILDGLWITTIGIFEIRFGIELLAEGPKRRRLEEAFSAMLDEDIERRVLSFDQAAADAAGRLATGARKRGRPVDIRDIEIAGIALSQGAALATRNVRHFDGLGLKIVDPWNT